MLGQRSIGHWVNSSSAPTPTHQIEWFFGPSVTFAALLLVLAQMPS